MDEFQCSWCRRSFYLKDGHFCFLKGKPDHEYSESFLDELEKLAERLEAATRNQDCTSDDFRHSNPKTQAPNIQLNSSLDSGSNFLTKNILQGEQVTSSPVSPFITQCHGSRLDVSRSDSHVSAQQSIFEASQESSENSLFGAVETLQGDFCRADDNNSNNSENLSSQNDSGLPILRPVKQMKRKNTSFGVNTNTCRKKENKSSAFNRPRKWAYLDAISASPMCIERDGNNAEAQKGKDYSKIKSISAKITQIDDYSTSDISTNSVALGSLSDAVSLPGPSGIHTQSHRSGKEKRFICDVCGKDFSSNYNLKVHLRTHAGEKPFECPTCDKRFTHQSHLKSHLRTHTGEKPFVCDICRKGFTKKKILRQTL
ncbi:Putative zinc finger and SCAN domain-containing protein 5C [Araneus ventricosus]|uniref:Zinc finger and SCAN domain-containing protein 5C n=1 Tax=Araneus ventricosus TaxID=182803 RepID=A0A4Y2PUZ0_ARAVE|nr:Putative zinc finger and SCAN domain-containing protein 5C [Araneus ventricosus]